NILTRMAGVPVYLWQHRGRLDDMEAYLVGGLLAGVGAYLIIGHPGDSNQYFTRAGWIFGSIASGWGWVHLADRLPARWRGPAALAAAWYASELIAAQLVFARPGTTASPFAPLHPILGWVAVLTALTLVGVALCNVVAGPVRPLRWRPVSGFALLT